MLNFDYYCQTKIVMGPGRSKEVPGLLKEMTEPGATVMVVSDPGVKKAGIVKPVLDSLEDAGYRVVDFDQVSPNPRDTECLMGAEVFQKEEASAVLAIGGGSPIDTAKAVALLGPNGGRPEDYVEGRRAYTNAAPILCIPTTAGTGSEVTRSSVITLADSHRKITLKHAMLRPITAVLDPELTLTVPKDVTAATGVDALVHAIEGYSCKVTNPVSQAMGARAMEVIVEHLPQVFEHGADLQARAKMQEGSLLAGLCFGSADVAAVHCLAEALGSLYDTPHGVANAIFLPHVMEFNAQENVPLHAEMARLMKMAEDNDPDEEAVEKFVRKIDAFTKQLDIPLLSEIPSVQEEDFERMAELAERNNSTPSNARTITKEDYLQILTTAFQSPIL
ncbi:iron-containing alcohol dehydrogenase [Halobacillus litoralis]|uniref:iron-containing alcohol dehydrogenase n=1 Tax=Halobacillus litoralis TaxID=45668 RepID=UPI00136E7375|nr:iron-containing alcohol dehydrogenase [Halobacillus litoralis]MYL39188.1 iron-containing alcohol dehydrogenase [Halobacillus litoralis]